MNIFKIETDSSIWFLDDGAMMYARLPRNENPNHPILSYGDIGKSSHFIYAHPIYDSGARICIHVDEPNVVFPDLHRRIQTGTINHMSDDFVDMGELEDCPGFV